MIQAWSSREQSGLLGGSAQQPVMTDFLGKTKPPMRLHHIPHHLLMLQGLRASETQGIQPHPISWSLDLQRKWTCSIKQSFLMSVMSQHPDFHEYLGNYVALRRATNRKPLKRLQIKYFIESAAAVKRVEIKPKSLRISPSLPFPALKRNLLFCKITLYDWNKSLISRYVLQQHLSF